MRVSKDIYSVRRSLLLLKHRLELAGAKCDGVSNCQFIGSGVTQVTSLSLVMAVGLFLD